MRIVLTGIGGQGILFTTRIIAEAATGGGMNVVSTETHGMAQRGGSVTSHIKIGDYHSPLIRKGTADAALCLTVSELATALSFVKPGGACFINSPPGGSPADLASYAERNNISLRFRDANAEALKLGNARCANQILLGAMSAHLDALPSPELMVNAIRAASPAKAAAINIEAFNLGCRRRG